MKKLLGIVVLGLLIFNSAEANIIELNVKLIELEKKIDKCLETKDKNICEDLNLFTTFLIEVLGNEEYAKHMNSDKCKIGTKCGATISRISGKFLQFMELNLNELEEILKKEEKNQEQNKITLSVKDAITAQIYSCWSIPLGLPYNENLLVRIKLELNQDGTIKKVVILDTDRMNESGQGYYKVLAESVMRAIKLCEPFRFPSTDYEKWKSLQLNFDAREMLGG